MRAVFFDGALTFSPTHPEPTRLPGWAKVKVAKAGICGTDLEIVKGYMGFLGVLGHEFVGRVVESDTPALLGKRVVGEINAACGHCPVCAKGLGRHCLNRSVLGIAGLDGCMADFCVLPDANLLPLPATLSDRAATLVEPLAAACEILEQVPLAGDERAVVLGDGRLGALCAWVLASRLPDVTLLGHHPEKLATAAWRNLRTELSGGSGQADLVVEATGTGRGLVQAMALCRPRGTIVLKSTVAAAEAVNLSPLVINEITVVGSRCGRFSRALDLLAAFPDLPLERLVSAEFPVERALDAFERARRKDAFKVLLDFAG